MYKTVMINISSASISAFGHIAFARNHNEILCGFSDPREYKNKLKQDTQAQQSASQRDLCGGDIDPG